MADTDTVRYARVEDTTWPVPLGAGWVQRYGTPDAIVEQRLTVASIIQAYSHLLDPALSMRDATAALRRARRAAREVHIAGSTDG